MEVSSSGAQDPLDAKSSDSQTINASRKTTYCIGRNRTIIMISMEPSESMNCDSYCLHYVTQAPALNQPDQSRKNLSSNIYYLALACWQHFSRVYCPHCNVEAIYCSLHKVSVKLFYPSSSRWWYYSFFERRRSYLDVFAMRFFFVIVTLIGFGFLILQTIVFLT